MGDFIKIRPIPCLTPCMFRSLMCCYSWLVPFEGTACPGPLVATGSLESRAISACPGDVASRAARLCCRHMVFLKEQYGKQVVVNLLGSRGGEEVLNRAFKVRGFPLTRGGGRRGSQGAPALGGLPRGLETAALRSSCLWRFFYQSFSFR